MFFNDEQSFKTPIFKDPKYSNANLLFMLFVGETPRLERQESGGAIAVERLDQMSIGGGGTLASRPEYSVCNRKYNFVISYNPPPTERSGHLCSSFLSQRSHREALLQSGRRNWSSRVANGEPSGRLSNQRRESAKGTQRIRGPSNYRLSSFNPDAFSRDC
jgi:hypothetical protein